MKIWYGVFNFEIRNGEFISYNMETSAGTWEKARNNFVFRIKQLYPKYLLTEIYKNLKKEFEYKHFVILPFTPKEWKEFRKTFK